MVFRDMYVSKGLELWCFKMKFLPRSRVANSNIFQPVPTLCMHTIAYFASLSDFSFDSPCGHYPCPCQSRLSRLSRLIAKWINQPTNMSPLNQPSRVSRIGFKHPNNDIQRRRFFRVSSSGSATWELSSSGSKFRWNLRESGVPTYHTKAPTFSLEHQRSYLGISDIVDHIGRFKKCLALNRHLILRQKLPWHAKAPGIADKVETGSQVRRPCAGFF